MDYRFISSAFLLCVDHIILYFLVHPILISISIHMLESVQTLCPVYLAVMEELLSCAFSSPASLRSLVLFNLLISLGQERL